MRSETRSCSKLADGAKNLVLLLSRVRKDREWKGTFINGVPHATI